MLVFVNSISVLKLYPAGQLAGVDVTVPALGSSKPDVDLYCQALRLLDKLPPSVTPRTAEH